MLTFLQYFECYKNKVTAPNQPRKWRAWQSKEKVEGEGSERAEYETKFLELLKPKTNLATDILLN